MGLLLQEVDVTFPHTNLNILLSDLFLLLRDQVLQLIDSLSLLSQLQLLVLTLSLELVNLRFNLRQLVSCDLQVSLCLKPHILNLGLVRSVLLDNLVVLSLTILHNLSHHLFIVALQCFNLLFQFMNESPLLVDEIIMIFLVHIDGRGVLFVNFLLGR